MKSLVFWPLSLGLALGTLPLFSGCSEAAADPTETVKAAIAPPAEPAAVEASVAGPAAVETSTGADAATTPATEQATPQPTDEATAQAPEQAMPLEAAKVAAPATDAASPEPATEIDLAKAPVTLISTPKPVTNIRTAGPTAEVVKLSEAGTEDAVMLAFVAKSTQLFNPSVDEIIYMNDIGVPSTVVMAMIQHDQALKGTAAKEAPASVSEWNVTQSAPQDQYAPAASEGLAYPDNSSQYMALPEGAPAPLQMAPQPDYPTGTYAATEPAPAPAEITDDTFYDSLAPYGNWVNVEGYGPCWQPTVVLVNPYWQPYYDCGHWAYTDCGWYWMSGYSWGWAPFHYGRWFRHDRIGWCWAPDRVWAPSWVCWRYTSGYCGWAPLPPGAWYRPGLGLTYWGRNVTTSFGFGLGAASFSFVAWGHFQDPHLQHYAMAPQQLNRTFQQSVTVTRISGDRHGVSNYGLPADRVTAATHQPVRQFALRESPAPARSGAHNERLNSSAGTLEVFRPTVTPARSLPAGSAATQIAQGATAARVAQPMATSDAGLLSVSGNPRRDLVGNAPVALGSAASTQTAGVPSAAAVRQTAPRGSTPPNGTVNSSARYQSSAPAPVGVPTRSVADLSRGLNPRTAAATPATTSATVPRQIATPNYPTAQVPRYTTPGARPIQDLTPTYTPAIQPTVAPSYVAPSAQVPRYTPAPVQQPRVDIAPPAPSYTAPTPSAPASSAGRTVPTASSPPSSPVSVGSPSRTTR